MKTTLFLMPLILGTIAIGTDPDCQGEDNPMAVAAEPGCGPTCDPNQCEDAYNNAMAQAACACPSDAMIPDFSPPSCGFPQGTMDQCTGWTSTNDDLNLCEKLACASKCFTENMSSCSAAAPVELSATQTLDEKLERCYRIAAMGDDDTWNCRDDGGWFLRCARELGIPEAHGLALWCKDCDDGDAHGHLVVMYKRGTEWCPGEPEKGERSQCCSASKSDAHQCALDLFCGGTWWNPSKPPQTRYSGCEPDKYKDKSCEHCIKEPCTANQCKQACELLDLPEYLVCRTETTNVACTGCCIESTTTAASKQKCLGDAGCASKP